MRSIQRGINIEAVFTDDGLIRMKAVLSDTYHNMSVEVLASERDRKILEISASIERGVNKECPSSVENLQKLVGLRLGSGFSQRALEQIGGNRGCTHLTNLVMQINASTVIFLFEPENPSPEVIRMRDVPWCERPPSFFTDNAPQLKNSCHAYREE